MRRASRRDRHRHSFGSAPPSEGYSPKPMSSSSPMASVIRANWAMVPRRSGVVPSKAALKAWTCSAVTAPTYSAVKFRDSCSKSNPSQSPLPLPMCTSSASMWKNFWASSTTLTSLWSGTPTPPLFNSIRTRKRAISFSLMSSERLLPGLVQALDHLTAQTVLYVCVVPSFISRDEAFWVVFHHASEVAGSGRVVAALDGHQDQSLESHLGLSAQLQELERIAVDALQVEYLHAHGDQVGERLLRLRVERQQA